MFHQLFWLAKLLNVNLVECQCLKVFLDSKMPQELHVLQCYNCETFQVDIVKKVPKWVCKMCGEKQSVKKVYGTGTGKDCRLLVQSLNEQRLIQPQCDAQDPREVEICDSFAFCEKTESKASKWAQFIETPGQVLKEVGAGNVMDEVEKKDVDVSCDNIFEDKNCELDFNFGF